MRNGFGLIAAVLAAMLTGTGCCRLCQRWCDDRQPCGCPTGPRYSPAASSATDHIPPPGVPTSGARSDGEFPGQPATRSASPVQQPTGAYGGTDH